MTGVIVHEWLEPHGGAERVMEEIGQAFPDAPIVALWDNAPARFGSRVTETWLGKSPLRNHKALALPIMPLVWRSLGPVDAEWVLCSSHLFAHHARFAGPARDATKFVYAYTPARYIWNPELDARGDSRFARLASIPLKPLDRRRAGEADHIAAISKFVARRVNEHWRRDCEVIYPPVAVERILNRGPLSESDAAIVANLPSDYVMGASRFVSYKRLDAVIDFARRARVPALIAGGGPMEKSLRELAADAGVEVRIVSQPSDRLMWELYSRATAFVFPPIEDFGIVPVEAMATGTPVIAHDVGGASETVEHGVSGVLVGDLSQADAVSTLQQARELKRDACIARALRFDSTAFRMSIRAWVDQSAQGGSRG